MVPGWVSPPFRGAGADSGERYAGGMGTHSNEWIHRGSPPDSSEKLRAFVWVLNTNGVSGNIYICMDPLSTYYSRGTPEGPVHFELSSQVQASSGGQVSWDRDRVEVDPASAGLGTPGEPLSPSCCSCRSDGCSGRVRVESGTYPAVLRQMDGGDRALSVTVRGSVGGMSRVMALTRPLVCPAEDGL